MRIPSWEEELSLELTGWTTHCYESFPSTMDGAREATHLATTEKPLLVIAKEQTKGRGQQGRSWDAPLDSLACTAVFTSSDEEVSLEGYSLVVGYAVARALEHFDVKVGLKWPNDIYSLNEKKVGGILIEIFRQEGQQYVLTGIGLNLAHRSQVITESEAIFQGGAPTVPAIAAAIMKELGDAWGRFLTAGFAGFHEEWSERALFFKRRFLIEAGKESLEGIFTGVDARGRLLLSVDGEVRAFASAHIREIQ